MFEEQTISDSVWSFSTISAMVNVKIKQARNLCITSCFVTGLQGLHTPIPAPELAWIRRIISDLFLSSHGMDASKVKSWWNKVLLSCEGIFKSKPVWYRRRVETQSRSWASCHRHMRNARNKDNTRLFLIEEWLSRNQIQAYFLRLSV